MDMNSQQKVSFNRQSNLAKFFTVACALGLTWMVSCKSDPDNEVNDPASGGRDGATPGVSAGKSSTGGTSAIGVGGTQNGATAGATGDLSTGGASAGAANDGQAGWSQSAAGAAPTAQGGTSQGGTPSVSGASSILGIAGATATCPAYSPPPGKLLTPPSNDFETEIGDWTTMTAKTESIKRSQSATNACQGSWYLACDGATRSGGWDGPKLDILEQLVAGHQYVVTAAARFNPGNAPASAGALTLSTAMACTDTTIATTFRRLQEGITTTDWVRLTGTLQPSLQGCTQLSEVTVYVETDNALKGYSIDLDDFQLWDVTPAATVEGTGGAAGAAGSGS